MANGAGSASAARLRESAADRPPRRLARRETGPKIWSYRGTQPPTRPEEHPLGEVQENWNVAVGVLFGLSPRATQAREHPLTHSMVVPPVGALTINSKSGAAV